MGGLLSEGDGMGGFFTGLEVYGHDCPSWGGGGIGAGFLQGGKRGSLGWKAFPS